ncbi:MAG: acyltransferase, partial [Gammaproteobacteria bacterium]
RRTGIEIGDDGWIGAGAAIVDGVRIGAHAIVGAGAVVTRDVPAYAVVVGNPARVLRDRRAPRPPAPRAVLADFAARVREEIPPILARHRHDDTHYADLADGAPTLRALCDAVEIAALCDATPAPRETLVAALQATQEATTGLPLDAGQAPGAATPPLGDFQTAYQVLAVGYALECLGARYARPIASVAALSPAALLAWLDALPLREQPWNAGALIDALASALWFNRAHAGVDGPYALLFEWLARQVFPHTGLWAGGQRQQGWLQPVNGFYRIVRGSYAQFGVGVPQPASTIDTVLAHCRFYEDFATRGATACNVLDALYALWLCGRATAHRRDDARAFAARQIGLIVARWQSGRGFAFAPGQPASLHGTEMGLAALATAATLLDTPEAWPLRPRGIHRLQEQPA